MSFHLKFTIRNYFLLFLFFLLSMFSSLGQYKTLAIIHVTIIDIVNNVPRKNETVLIQNGRIIKIQSSRKKISDLFTKVDAKNKYLIPGLWDAHVHSLWDSVRATEFFPLFIANGVTSVREMGGPMPAADQVAWRNKVANEEVLGPRLFVPGPFLDGERPIWPGSASITNSERARAVVDSLKVTGVDFLKMYSGIKREPYFALVDEAKKQNILFEGHVPLEISAEEASNSGQKSIEHLMGVMMGSSSSGNEIQKKLMTGVNMSDLNGLLVDTYDETKAQSLFKVFIRNKTWQVPTLTIRHARAFLQDLQVKDDPRLKYVSKTITDSWKPRNDARQPATQEAIINRKRLEAV